MVKQLLFRSPDFYRVIETLSTHRDKFHFAPAPRWRIRGIELYIAVNIRSLSGIFVQDMRACVFSLTTYRKNDDNNDDDHQARLFQLQFFSLYFCERIRSK